MGIFQNKACGGLSLGVIQHRAVAHTGPLELLTAALAKQPHATGLVTVFVLFLNSFLSLCSYQMSLLIALSTASQASALTHCGQGSPGTKYGQPHVREGKEDDLALL